MPFVLSGMSPSPPEGCERLGWDSNFFGLPIARVTRRRITRFELASVVNWAEDASVDCVYFLADAEDPESIRAAEGNGFSLTDVRVSLERSAPAPSGQAGDASLRLATLADIERLASIARVSHRNTRFHRDARFDPARADELYAVWIDRAVRGELANAVWVVDTGTGPAGYLAMSCEGERASIGLVAVDPSCRGRGLGERLVQRAMRWAAEEGAARISVITQGHHAPAVRFYERAGFEVQRVELWYHYWSRRPSTAGSQ